jgi:hypothetical protein
VARDDSMTRWPVGLPVETPAGFVAPDHGVRRHRPITGLSGAVLLVCAFLPAFDRPDAYVIPIATPAVLAPYLFGLPFLVLSRVRGERGLRLGAIGLRAMAIALAGTGLVTMMTLHAVGILELLVAMLLAMTVGFHAPSERRVAATTAVFGGFACAVFGLCATSEQAMVGVFLALFAAIGLLLGGLWWLGDATSPAVPRAVISSTAWHDRSSSS